MTPALHLSLKARTEPTDLVRVATSRNSLSELSISLTSQLTTSSLMTTLHYCPEFLVEQFIIIQPLV